MRTALVTAGFLGLVYGYAQWVGGVDSVTNPRGDAIVVHAGGRGERLDHALELMEAGAAETLIVMYGRENETTFHLCARSRRYEILCPAPTPRSTVGEARAVGALAKERGWTSLITVTTDYHLRRALLLDRRCSGVEVVGSSAPSGRSGLGYWRRLLKEMAALPQAAVTGC